MAKRIRITVGDVTAEAALYDDRAPRTTAALWEALPIRERTIQVRWSGFAWRTEGDYELVPAGSLVENVAGMLGAGDIIYSPGTTVPRIGIAYGPTLWRNPLMEPLDIAHIGQIDTNLDAFVERCLRIVLDGPLDVQISRVG